MQSPHQITIHAVTNGFVVTVGCKTFVFGSVTALVTDLKRYLENPGQVEKEFLGNALYSEDTEPGMETRIPAGERAQTDRPPPANY